MGERLRTTIAGSLPKPGWLAEPERLWAPWKLEGPALAQAKLDATLLAIKLQEDAGIDIVGDGEQARVHFVHGFLANLDGIDFAPREDLIGIRKDRYKAEVPTVVGADPPQGLRPRGRGAGRAGAYETKAQVHAAGPDDHRRHHRRRALRPPRGSPPSRSPQPLNEEARELVAIGIDVVQFDEPAFNVYMDEVADWGMAALEEAAKGLACTPCRAHLLRLRHQGQSRLEVDARLAMAAIRGDLPGDREKLDRPGLPRVPELARADRPASACSTARTCSSGRWTSRSDAVESPEEVAATIRAATRFVAPEKLFPCTNCGMAPMRREIAYAKLKALAAGAAIVRAELAP